MKGYDKDVKEFIARYGGRSSNEKAVFANYLTHLLDAAFDEGEEAARDEMIGLRPSIEDLLDTYLSFEG